MATGDPADPISAMTRVLQIIVGSLVAGLLTFLTVVVLLSFQSGGKGLNSPPMPPPGAAAGPGVGGEPPLPVLTVAAFTFAVILFPLSLLVPKLIVESLVKKMAAEKKDTRVVSIDEQAQPLMMVYQTQKIVGAAMNEGAAFFALIAYLIERNPIALGLALFLIVGVALRFPQRVQVAQWVEDQCARIALLRQSGF